MHDDLTKPEAAEYVALVVAFLSAKAERDFKASDAIRAQLLEWQEVPEHQFGTWLPMFEKPDHRQRRIEARGH